MIQDNRQIEIESFPETVFSLIETMPNKFPIYTILEAQPFFFLRVLLVDGLRTAIAAAKMDRSNCVLILSIGDSIGPFTLTESERPFIYWFALRSFFFNCRTGYSLSAKGNATTLSFQVIAENPSFLERVWWLSTKPFHLIFTNKLLMVIKEKAEGSTQERA